MNKSELVKVIGDWFKDGDWRVVVDDKERPEMIEDAIKLSAERLASKIMEMDRPDWEWEGILNIPEVIIPIPSQATYGLCCSEEPLKNISTIKTIKIQPIKEWQNKRVSIQFRVIK